MRIEYRGREWGGRGFERWKHKEEELLFENRKCVKINDDQSHRIQDKVRSMNIMKKGDG